MRKSSSTGGENLELVYVCGSTPNRNQLVSIADFIAAKPLYRYLEVAIFAFDSGLQFVSFATRHFQVEHQVLNVQPQLRKGFLNEAQDATTTQNRFGHAV